MSTFKCKHCECISTKDIVIRTDVDKMYEWEEAHAKRIELRAAQEIILVEFERIASIHNSHWYNFLTHWCVGVRLYENYLDITDIYSGKIIKSIAYDNTVMSCWLNLLHKRPSFDYIQCPVCKCNKYTKR